MPAKRSSSFVDSNIWLYALIESGDATKSARATGLIRSVYVVVSTQVVNEVSVNLIRKAGFKEAQIRQLIDAFHARYRVAKAEHSTLRLASEIRERYSFSFWDGLIAASAIESACDRLYSEDMQHGLLVEEKLQIINPFAA